MRKAIFVLVILAALGTWAWWIRENKQKESPANSASGTIECDEVHIASRYGGRVEKIFANEGDALTNAQLIIQLTAPELVAQRAESAAMLADLEAGARPEELAAAKAEWEAAAADLDLARNEAKRALELFAKATISEIERDRTTSRATTMEKTVSAAKSRYELLQAGPRTNLVEQARATLKRIDAQLGELNISAPTNCVLEVLSVKVGDVLPPNREVATLILTQHLWLRAYVPQPWLGKLKVGQTLECRMDALPGKTFRGEVEQIAREAEFTPRNVQTADERVKRTFAIKVRLQNDSGELRPGMSAVVVF